jgi:hypothetical protein
LRPTDDFAIRIRFRLHLDFQETTQIDRENSAMGWSKLADGARKKLTVIVKDRHDKSGYRIVSN